MKKMHVFLLAAGMLLTGGVKATAEEAVNLVSNGSFETYEDQSNFMFGDYSDFSGWERTGFGAVSEKSDVFEGSVAVNVGRSTAANVYQSVSGLGDDHYDAGRKFELVIHYKVLKTTSKGDAAIECYWEAAAGAANADAIKNQDAALLQRELNGGVQSEWQTLTIQTTRPAKAKGFHIRLKAVANAYVLYDDIRFAALPKTAPDEPFLSVSPKSLSAVSCEKGQSADFPPLHIEQGNVTGVTTFELSYTDADQFRLSRSSLPAEEGSCDLIITYAPTRAGTHKAVLNIDNSNHTSLFQSITLNASCTDPSAVPSITVTPSVIPAFETVIGKQVSGTFRVKSENCTDLVYLSVSHVQGAAFTIASSMLAKNWESDVTVYFTPLEAGTYQSTVTITSAGADPVVVTLNGTAKAKSEETIDWSTSFTWDVSHPAALLNEDFESLEHNGTLVLAGWQNVAAVEERPWWGYDESHATPPRAANKCAKATAYQYGKNRTGIWESWLVTPALDYKKAAGKVFTFDVMAEYLADEGNEAVLEVYYVFLDENGNAGFQNLTESFDLPSTAADNESWRTFHLNLTNQPEIADVFFIAFRFSGPNGGDGAVSYYVDNVSWGRGDLPTITPGAAYLLDSLAVPNVERVIGTLHIDGANLTEEIALEVSGSRYINFGLSAYTLPAEGGDVTITFLSDQEGVHEAYLRLSSKGAADVYVPMAVRCTAATGTESVRISETGCRKVLRNGRMVIVRGGKEYDATGKAL